MSENVRGEIRTEIKAIADGIEEEHRYDEGIDVFGAVSESVDSSPWVFKTAKAYQLVTHLRFTPEYHSDDTSPEVATDGSNEPLDSVMQRTAFRLLHREVTTLLRERDNGIDV